MHHFRKEQYQLMSYVFSDIGLWTWYAEDIPEFVQLEFNRTMLYLDLPDKQNAPSSQVALQFQDPVYIGTYSDPHASGPKNWLKALNQDSLEPLSIHHEYFSFRTTEIKKMYQHWNPEPYFGDTPTFNSKNICLGFAADNFGIIIEAKELVILTHGGQLQVSDVMHAHEKWWKYWKEYWQRRDTKKPLPYDGACEITIPTGK